MTRFAFVCTQTKASTKPKKRRLGRVGVHTKTVKVSRRDKETGKKRTVEKQVFDKWAAAKDEPEDMITCKGPGRQLTRQSIAKRFLVACRALGEDRLKDLTIHYARHSFGSHALANGKSLAEVRGAMGHSNISTTSVYLHTIEDEDDGDLFSFRKGRSDDVQQ